MRMTSREKLESGANKAEASGPLTFMTPSTTLNYFTVLLRCDWYTIKSAFKVFSRSVVSNSLQPHEPQHARPPCPSPTPGVHPNPRPLSRWCHPTISSSVVLFSSHLQSFPASGSFQMSQIFASGGQRIGVSASISVLPMNTQDWSRGNVPMHQ